MSDRSNGSRRSDVCSVKNADSDPHLCGFAFRHMK